MRLNFHETHLVPWRDEGEEPQTVVESVLYQFMTGTVVELGQVSISVLKQQEQWQLESDDVDGQTYPECSYVVAVSYKLVAGIVVFLLF